MVYFITTLFTFVPSKPNSQSFASPFRLPQKLQIYSILGAVLKITLHLYYHPLKVEESLHWKLDSFRDVGSHGRSLGDLDFVPSRRQKAAQPEHDGHAHNFAGGPLFRT